MGLRRFRRALADAPPWSGRWWARSAIVLVLVLAVTVAIDLVWPWWPFEDDESVRQALLERGLSTLFVGGAVIMEREWRAAPDREASKADDPSGGTRTRSDAL